MGHGPKLLPLRDQDRYATATRKSGAAVQRRATCVSVYRFGCVTDFQKRLGPRRKYRPKAMAGSSTGSPKWWGDPIRDLPTFKNVFSSGGRRRQYPAIIFGSEVAAGYRRDMGRLRDNSPGAASS